MTLHLRRPIYAPSLKALTENLRQRFGEAVRVEIYNASSVHITAKDASLQPAASAFVEGFFAGRNSRS